jgi:hypothetical protein
MKKKIKILLILAGAIDLGILMILLNLSVMLAVGLGVLHIIWTYIVYNAITQLSQYNSDSDEWDEDTHA